MLRLLVALMASLSPSSAAHVAAWVYDVPAEALLRVCHRESRCTAVGEHRIDAHLSTASYWGQVRLGHLDPRCQDPGGWATRGAWGLNASAHWQYLPPCYQPQWLDVPIVSAVVAAQKWERVCRGKRRRRWCPRR